MTPTQLRAFVAIVRHGASKDAAAELGVTEAAVSSHVASLRRELDDVLFERSASGLRFTPGGLRLATRAVELLGLQDQTRQEVRSAAGGRRVLGLAVSSLFGEYAAPGLIELFSARANDLDIEMSAHPPGRIGALLASRAADAAIGPRPGNLPDALVIQDFLRYQLVIVTGPGHPLAGRRVRPEELADTTWFLGPSAVDEHGLAWEMLRRFAVPEQNQRIFQSHAAALIDAGRRPTGAAAGGAGPAARAGVALAPVQYVTEDLAAGRLVRVDVPGGQIDGVWSVMTLPRSQASPAAAELVRFVSTPRAIQAMLSGSGAGITHFKPRVHITLWS